jgi:beta-glucanase (GH16 family)
MTESSSGATLSPTIITDANSDVWGLAPSKTNGSQVVHNGVIDSKTLNVALLLYYNKGIYHKNLTNLWYRYVSGGWQATSDPRVPRESADGTVVSTIGPAIIDSAGSAWMLVTSASLGWQIAVDGTVDPVTQQVTLLLYKNRRIYQEASGGGWWYKSGKSDPTWILASDPRVSVPLPTPPAPTPTPPPPTPTPSTPTPVGTSAPSTAPTGWPVVFFDDFTSFKVNSSTPTYSMASNPTATTSATSQWMLNVCGGTYHINGAMEQGYDCSPALNGINPFSQSGSILTITARLPTPTEAAAMAKSPNYTSGNIISGALNTQNFLQKTFGYWEMNAKLPAGSGMWPTFWLIPDASHGGNPPEFDILEGYGSRPNVLSLTSHYDTSGVAHLDATVPVNTQTGFHTYGGLWTPHYLAWYFDGTLLFQTTRGFSGNRSFAGTNPMICIMHFAMGTGLGEAAVQASNLPATMQIDWFRYSSLPT